MTIPAEILVCVKHAIRVQEPVKFTSDRRNLAAGCRDWICNRADHFALEAAIRLRESGRVETISCITAGPDPAVEALIYCLAAGADRAVHILVPDDIQFNPWAVATLLGSAVHHFGGRLIFTAQCSSDGESGLVPVYLASSIGAAYMSHASDIQLSGNEVEIHRKIERGHRQVWKAALPAVVAFNKDVNLPRYVSVAALMSTRQRLIVRLTPEMLGVSLAALPWSAKLEYLMPARARSRKLQTPIPGQSAAERMMAITTGGANEGRKRVLQGLPEELATEAVAYLNEKRLLKRPAQIAAGQVTTTVTKKDDAHED